LQVFSDAGESAKTADRPQFQAMMACEKKVKPQAVIVCDRHLSGWHRVHRNEGFGTPQSSLLYTICTDTGIGKSVLASPRGFEPLLSP
jgi:hypothetical protein